MLDLGFVRAAGADHGEFDFARGVFVYGKITQDHRADRRAARLAEFQGGIGVAGHKDLLDGDFVRVPGINHGGESAQQALEARREIRFCQQIQWRGIKMA